MAILIASTPAAAAPPTGTFKVEGRNPGGEQGPPAYTGIVTITRAGDVFSVQWIVGAAKTPIEGRGLFEKGVLAVTYPNAQPAGPALVVYTKQGKDWVGRWIIPGARQAGVEILTPK